MLTAVHLCWHKTLDYAYSTNELFCLNQMHYLLMCLICVAYLCETRHRLTAWKERWRDYISRFLFFVCYSERKNKHGASWEVHFGRRSQPKYGCLPTEGAQITTIFTGWFTQQVHIRVKSTRSNSSDSICCYQHTQGTSRALQHWICQFIKRDQECYNFLSCCFIINRDVFNSSVFQGKLTKFFIVSLPTIAAVMQAWKKTCKLIGNLNKLFKGKKKRTLTPPLALLTAHIHPPLCRMLAVSCSCLCFGVFRFWLWLRDLVFVIRIFRSMTLCFINWSSPLWFAIIPYRHPII